MSIFPFNKINIKSADNFLSCFVDKCETCITFQNVQGGFFYSMICPRTKVTSCVVEMKAEYRGSSGKHQAANFSEPPSRPAGRESVLFSRLFHFHQEISVLLVMCCPRKVLLLFIFGRGSVELCRYCTDLVFANTFLNWAKFLPEWLVCLKSTTWLSGD